MKNVLYISPSVHVKGGISSVIKGYLESDLAKHHNIFLVASHIDGHKFLKYTKAFVGLFEALFYLLIKGIDIVHVHGGDIISFKRKFYYIKFLSLISRNVIYHHHGSYFMRQYKLLNKKWKNRVKRTFEGVDLLICLSDSWRISLQSIAPGANMAVIPNSVKLPSDCRKMANKHVKLTFLGLIGDRKGIFDLLRIVKRLIDDHNSVKLTIGGNGEIRRLHREIRELGIANAVQFRGWIDNEERDKILRNTDIFVLPSYAEGMPMSILEAMAYSIPVVSTFVGGIPELVKDGQTGFLVKPGDLDDLHRKIKCLVDDGGLRRKLGRKGRQLIRANNNIEQITQQMSEIYNTF